MKSLHFTLLFCLLSFAGNAQVDEKMTLQDVGGGIVKVMYKVDGKDNIKVSILGKKDRSIFTETIRNTGTFVRPYNLTGLDDADFKIVIEDKGGKTEKPFSFTVRKVESSFDVSKIGNAKNKYLLTVESKEFDQVSIRILDGSKNAIHEQSIQVNGRFSVVFNLDKVNGSPTFEIWGTNGDTKTFAF